MFTIAHYTFIEYLRKKMLYIIVWLGALLMVGTVLAGSLALSEQTKVIRDFSIGLIEIAGLILVLFFWSSVLQQEISNNTIFLLNAKNVKRSNIILGKFLGFSLVIWIFIALMTAVFLIISFLYKVPLTWMYFLAIIGIGIKLEVLLAICLFFSSFVSSFVSLLVSLLIYFLAHTLSFVVYYTTVLKKENYGPVFTLAIQWFYHIFPNFTALSIQDFFDVPFLPTALSGSFAWTVAFHIIYIIILLFLTVRIFNKKQF